MKKKLDEMQMEIKRNGIYYDEGFFNKKEISSLKTALLSEANLIIKKNKNISKLPHFQQTNKISTLIKVEKILLDKLNNKLISLISRFTRMDTESWSINSQALVTPPQKGEWKFPVLNWHVDLKSFSTSSKIPGLQIFILLDDINPKGGSTLALPGSHLIKRKNIDIEDQKDNTIEMTGKAGDIYIMDIRVLHSPSFNTSNKIRLMYTFRYIFQN